MLILYDATTSKEKKKEWWGGDPDQIRYFGMSSCLSLTLVYDQALVGAHFALFVGKNMMSRATVSWGLENMKGWAPQSGNIRRALLIGYHGTWGQANKPAYDCIKAFCLSVDQTYAYADKWDTWEQNQCDIVVNRALRRVDINKTETDGGGLIISQNF